MGAMGRTSKRSKIPYKSKRRSAYSSRKGKRRSPRNFDSHGHTSGWKRRCRRKHSRSERMHGKDVWGNRSDQNDAAQLLEGRRRTPTAATQGYREFRISRTHGRNIHNGNSAPIRPPVKNAQIQALKFNSRRPIS